MFDHQGSELVGMQYPKDTNVTVLLNYTKHWYSEEK